MVKELAISEVTPCKWCDPDNLDYDVQVDLYDWTEQGTPFGHRKNIEFAYCPQCGREMDW